MTRAKTAPIRARRRLWSIWAMLSSLILVSLTSKADTLTVAVASNFAETLEQLTVEFERISSHDVRLVKGSSGRHFAQISNGAPFDLFFSADAERPRRLLKELRLPDSRLRSYAQGKLVLWGVDLIDAETTKKALEGGDFGALAIANPRLAPYGQAAVESLQAIGLWTALADEPRRLVRGENVAQAFQFVATGNADLGFVALSQVLAAKQSAYWVVPEDFYQPITQQLLVIRESDASSALLGFLGSERARVIIHQSGYGLPDPS